MATLAQIAANRRNAQKSTGPKTDPGKLKSARNSRRHGLSERLRPGEVLAAYEQILGRPVADGDDLDVAALRLAAAEVRLSHAYSFEWSVLRGGDEALRMAPEVDMIDEVVRDELVFRGSVPPDMLAEAQRLREKISRAGARSAQSTYARMRRYVREAELGHRRALRDWLAGD